MDVLLWLVLDISLFLLIILMLLFIRLSTIVSFLDKRVEIMREFLKKNEGFFSIFFLLIFAIEQIILIIFISKFGYNLDFLRGLISIFALVVVTTASLQKFVLETKRRYDNEERIKAKDYLESRENRNVTIVGKMLHEIDRLTKKIKNLEEK